MKHSLIKREKKKRDYQIMTLCQKIKNYIFDNSSNKERVIIDQFKN